jgi:hypothetical protein
MKKLSTVILFLILFACNNKAGDYKKPENALDAGREFIQQSLKGHFNTAKRYMLQDEENLYWLDKVSRDYNVMTEQDKSGYSNASININEVADVSDSITVINYNNSYKKRAQKVKVVKINNDWLVDFKYTFSGNL